ncbi:hypothetical protein F6R98_00895 [Candidatus Methylospira mobilis]|uniref:Chorismatase FkbO/Hyg5-like N-terminal domain-containing protein n=1 Tax=Candidatus Methylospira mobilis TaxID=1808979 RepID=A0A5Q0BBQ4_9GAMM|nr:hypothetical protein [Candidatus Methylospira mobilis]QFY41355.1 hypothetical protein F6R98_00895 [Candidatus Methylospira mobilis]WNV05420.1 hypothetical protein RP726_03155 [Candidatus Methylospira mobilis]
MENLYLNAQDFAARQAQPYDNVLGLVRFSDRPDPSPLHPDIPVLHVPAKPLDGGDEVYNIWRSADPPSYRRQDAISYSITESLLWGCLSLSETGGLTQTARFAYDEILKLLARQGMPHFYRIWHYIPDINQSENGTERYRLFNQGRQAALQGAGLLARHSAAASAVGIGGAALCMNFLAGKRPPLPIENPRQVSAYRYPPRYGASPPLFSRASLVRAEGQSTLFISGTASIAGHLSLHAGDVRAQTRETLANIGALLDEANRLVGGKRLKLADLEFKAYLRHVDDAALVADELRGLLDAAARVRMVQAAICRLELLVEIEAVARWDPADDTAL